MQSRKEALDYGLAFPDTYVETPFRDTNWQLVRVKCSKKAFLWIRMERLLEKCFQIGNSRMAPEQGELEHNNSRWFSAR